MDRIPRMLLALLAGTALLLAGACGDGAPSEGAGEAAETATVTADLAPTRTIEVAALPLGDAVKASGERLIALPFGSTQVLGDQPADDARVLVVMHGFGSEGYEWVYPLHQFVAAGYATYFYRWDWEQCPSDAADELLAALNTLATATPELDRLTVVGHSYGGVVVATAATRYEGSVPLDAHVVAAPLAGERRGCDGSEYAPASGVTLHQWRTQQALDAVYRDRERDPQAVDIESSEVTTLPAEYDGERLGHNRSLSWVADQIIARPD